MKGTIIYSPREVRYEDRHVPKIIEPTRVILKLSATCMCGSDLWTYGGIEEITCPTPMDHEYVGIIEFGVDSTLE